MSEQTPESNPVTRLGPDSGGRPPGGGPTGGGDARVYTWEWGGEATRRPGLPWIGIFLLVFGGLLLVRQVFPQIQDLTSVIVLAIGLAFLLQWAVRRGSGSLYLGSIITALAIPGVLNAAGIGLDTAGLSTFSLGVAFLFIALVRATTGGGWGWQAWLGGLLAIIGGANIANLTAASYLFPLLLIGAGVLLVLRGISRGD